MVTLEVDNRSHEEIDYAILKQVEIFINRTLEVEGFASDIPKEISFSLVTPEEIHQLNRDYRQVDRETDVLSFPMLEFPEDRDMLIYDMGIPVMLGDIIISLAQAKKQAEEYGNTLEREICYLTVHSVLHLLGYDHMIEEDKKEMRAREKKIMGDQD